MALSVKQIDESTHLSFLSGHPKEHFMQTPTWGKIKSDNGWSCESIGFFNGEDLAACALLLKKKLPVFNQYIYYCPRGPVADFSDRQQIREIFSLLSDYLKKNRGVFLTVDPDIVFCARDKYDKIVKAPDDFIEFMTAIGLKHGGFNKNFENNQPRYTFRLQLEGGEEAVYDNLDRMAKKNLNISSDSCIEVYKEDNLPKFFEIMHDTAERDSFFEGSNAYYERLFPMLKSSSMAEMYFAKYNPVAHLAAIDDQIDAQKNEIFANELRMQEKHMPKLAIKNTQLAEKIERIEKQRAAAKEYAEKYPQGIDLSTLITIYTKNRLWTVYGGSRSMLRGLAANYKITWAAITDALARNMEFVDFFGSTGDLSETNPLLGIYSFKKKFSGEYIEFPGEFYLVCNKYLYFIWTAFSPLLLKLKRKASRKSNNETKN